MQGRSRALLAAGAASALGALGGLVSAPVAHAQAGCSVQYTVAHEWPGGFTADVSVTNLGSPLSTWELTWSFTAGQQVQQAWNAEVAQSGSQVTATNAPWNGGIGTGGSASFGFNGSSGASNPVPTDFALNGTPCNGTTPPTDDPTSPPPTTSPPPDNPLPDTLEWVSGPELITPQSHPQHQVFSIKDPTVVHHNGEWQVYATYANSSAGAWGLMHTSFADWADAPSAPHTYLDISSAIGPGYRAAPQLVYFEPQDLWYLIYQTGLPSYSTSTDPSDPTSWSAPQNFQNSLPQVVLDNWNDTYVVDYWVICDDVNCYLFSHDGAGNLYRAQTTVGNFPNGFGNDIVLMQAGFDNRFSLWEASNVYQIKDTDEYLLLVEAIGGDGLRYFRSWTSNDLGTLQWTPHADTEANAFFHDSNFTFEPGVPTWSAGISHGEMLRDSNDQTLTIDACNMQYLYQGLAPGASGDYQQLPYRLGLLTQTNSPC